MKWFICIILVGFGHLPMAYCYGSQTSSSSSYGGNSYGVQLSKPVAAYAPLLSCHLGDERVCGTNGHENFLFDNQCDFNDFNGKQLKKGQSVLTKLPLAECYPSAPSQYDNPFAYCPHYCNRINKPVCGSYLNVQRNFTNECELRRHICETQENWQIILNGTCVSASCALEGEEVCVIYNNIQKSFPNLWTLYDDIRITKRNWHIVNMGPCPCPKDYKPICVQLGCEVKTVPNECTLQQEIKNATYWSILYYGECPLLPTNNTCGLTTTTPANGSARRKRDVFAELIRVPRQAETTPTTTTPTTTTPTTTTPTTTTPTTTTPTTTTPTTTTPTTTTPTTTTPTTTTPTTTTPTTTTPTTTTPTTTTPTTTIPTTTTEPTTTTLTTTPPTTTTAACNQTLLPIPTLKPYRPVYIVYGNNIIPYRPQSSPAYTVSQGVNVYNSSHYSGQKPSYSPTTTQYGPVLEQPSYSGDNYNKPSGYKPSSSPPKTPYGASVPENPSYASGSYNKPSVYQPPTVESLPSYSLPSSQYSAPVPEQPSYSGDKYNKPSGYNPPNSPPKTPYSLSVAEKPSYPSGIYNKPVPEQPSYSSGNYNKPSGYKPPNSPPKTSYNAPVAEKPGYSSGTYNKPVATPKPTAPPNNPYSSGVYNKPPNSASYSSKYAPSGPAMTEYGPSLSVPKPPNTASYSSKYAPSGPAMTEYGSSLPVPKKPAYGSGSYSKPSPYTSSYAGAGNSSSTVYNQTPNTKYGGSTKQQYSNGPYNKSPSQPTSYVYSNTKDDDQPCASVASQSNPIYGSSYYGPSGPAYAPPASYKPPTTTAKPIPSYYETKSYDYGAKYSGSSYTPPKPTYSSDCTDDDEDSTPPKSYIVPSSYTNEDHYSPPSRSKTSYATQYSSQYYSGISGHSYSGYEASDPEYDSDSYNPNDGYEFEDDDESFT